MVKEKPIVDEYPHPAPVYVCHWPVPERVEYDFAAVPLNGSARFARSEHTIRNRMYAYLKTPQGKGKKFIIRRITPNMCRIWRTA